MKTPFLIDTHAHLSFPDFKKDLDSILKNARDCGVSKIINIALGNNIKELKTSFDVGQNLENVFNAVGIHPNYLDAWDDRETDEISSFFISDKTVAVGETGLDYYRSPSNRERQRETFRILLKLAMEKNLPCIIHQREAFGEVIDILKEEKAHQKIPCIFHCFGGDRRQSNEIQKIGAYISLTGIITFKKADTLRETLRDFPIDRIMLETDCPFLSPEPKRGKRNEPSYTVYTARKLAEIKKVEFEKIAETTSINAVRVFRI